MLVAATWRDFELDRFFVPKELVLHVSAFAAGLLALRAIGRVRLRVADFLLVAYLALGIVSALGATNGWVAVRSVALTASGLVVFWSARGLRLDGLSRSMVGAVALAVVLGCATSLLQTYGIRTDFFSLNRAPGGTLGNRNFIAHMAAFGLPIVLLVALRARSWVGWLLAGAGATLVAATLVLTRSRAGFLAMGGVVAVLFLALVLSPALRTHGRAWRRTVGLVLLSVAGIAAVIALPNDLNWRSENPYLESLTGVANFQEGSGRGRVVQYRHSLRIARDHPLLGAGPGNWGVVYADYAADGDPSLDRSEPGRTANPWPSSDWIAFISERGFVATALLAVALALIAIAATRDAMRTHDADDALAATAIVAMIVATVIAGMFDAVLLLAQPMLLVWLAAGALWPVGAPEAETLPQDEANGLRETVRMAAVAGVIFIAGIGMVRSAAQLAGMGIYAHAETSRWLARAALIDPGSYELRIRLARGSSGLARAERCRHALAARALQPNAREARNLSSGCD